MNNTKTQSVTVKTKLQLPTHVIKNMRRNKDERIRLEQRLNKNEQYMRAALQKAGVDMSFLEKIDMEDRIEIDHYMKKERPQLINPKGNKDELVKLLSEYKNGVGKLRAYPANLLAEADADAITEDATHGWILPDNSSQLNLSAQSSGRGSGLLNEINADQDFGIVTFTFVPDSDGFWSFCPIIRFEGIFKTYANDTRWTSRFAYVYTDITVEVNQYTPTPPKTWSVIYRGGYNTNAREFIELTEFFDMPPQLIKANDPVTVTVYISVMTACRGTSYAEIDFSEGTRNFIAPVVMLSGPVL
jgi:hypothetical protein